MMKLELDKFRDELTTAGMLEEYMEAVELMALHELITLTPEYFEKLLAGNNGGPS